jgi:hypothetical protein
VDCEHGADWKAPDGVAEDVGSAEVRSAVENVRWR